MFSGIIEVAERRKRTKKKKKRKGRFKRNIVQGEVLSEEKKRRRLMRCRGGNELVQIQV